MKLFDEIMGLVRRYAPTLVAHLLLFLWLSLFVLDIARLPDGTSIWTRVSRDVERSLEAVGLSLQLWYVIAALLLAYLTAFEWVRGLVLSLPVLRLRFVTWRDPELLGHASVVLRLAPDRYKVDKALSLVIDRAGERVRQNNQRHPYQGMLDRGRLLIDYYGTVLVFLLATLAWVLGDARYARTEGGEDRVWLTVLLLAAVAVALRWVIRRHDARQQTFIGYWALYDAEREDSGGVEDPLAYQRRQTMERVAEQDLSWRRHPAAIVSGLLSRMLGKRSEKLQRRLNYPRLPAQEDWPLLASNGMRFSEETMVPPAELQAQSFASRFASFLERKGTGLAILTPELSGLAPAAESGGTVYSFASRGHLYPTFGIRLISRRSLDDPASPPRLCVESGHAPAFIAKIGSHPIETLIMGEYPRDGLGQWAKLFCGDLTAASLIPRDGPETKKLFEMEVARSVALEIGASYLLALVTESGTQARLVLQCFRIANSERLLLVWGFLSVRVTWEDDAPAVVDPWWKPAAWKRLIRPKEGMVRWTVVDYDPDRRLWHVVHSNMPDLKFDSPSLEELKTKIHGRGQHRAGDKDYISVVKVKPYWALTLPFWDRVLVRRRWLSRPRAEDVFEALAKGGASPSTVKFPGPGFGFAWSGEHLELRWQIAPPPSPDAQHPPRRPDASDGRGDP